MQPLFFRTLSEQKSAHPAESRAAAGLCINLNRTQGLPSHVPERMLNWPGQ